ncbi:MAG TPA: zinc-binding dehydrogenase [Methylomirabilota bacterium]|nr:zinc-binding dehydrogenase [Methylomirabilota bacterium]
MRAVVVERPGGLEQLRLAEVPDPVPVAGEVLIEVAFAGCNWSDVQKRRGVYPDPVTYPAILGLEVSGLIRAVGSGVRGLAAGDRVAALTGPRMLGGYAEQVAVPAAYVMRLPDAVPLDVGAAFPVVALTAYHLLRTAHRVREGEVVLVHSIGGAVGLLLTQIARAFGATVLGTVGTAGKGDRATAFGADLVIDRSREDFVSATLAFTRGRGVDLVIDSLGADVLPRSFDALRPYGRVINIGEAAGYPDFPVRPKLYERSTGLAGFELLHAGPGGARWRRGVRYVLGALATGRLVVPIEGRYPLGEAAEMHRRLEARGVSGKLLLDPGGLR